MARAEGNFRRGIYGSFLDAARTDRSDILRRDAIKGVAPFGRPHPDARWVAVSELGVRTMAVIHGRSWTEWRSLS